MHGESGKLEPGRKLAQMYFVVSQKGPGRSFEKKKSNLFENVFLIRKTIWQFETELLIVSA